MTVEPQHLFEAAIAAAQAAANAQNALLPPEAQRGFDCGFAWVTVKPAVGPFVTWCKKQIKEVGERSAEAHKFGSRGYAGGWTFHCPGSLRTQSISVHQAAAEAFAKVLNDNGLDAHVASRLD